MGLPELNLESLPGPETILRRELDNGLVVLARENLTSPSVVVSGYLPAGSLLEPPEQAGLASMTAGALMRGTEQHSTAELYEAIESIGARLNFSTSKHSTSFSGKALAEDLGVLLDLLHEVLLTPAFPAKQVNRLKVEKLTALAIRDQETSARADLAFSGLIYQDHPYAVPTEGNRDTVEQLTAAQLRAFRRKHYRPRGTVICVVGGVPAELAADTVTERFADWLAERSWSEPELPALTPLKEIVHQHVSLQGKSQTDVAMGFAGPPRADQDFIPAALANNILGRFGMYGRIGDVVREQAGLAYYAYSTLVGGHGPGPWQVTAGVHPSNLERAIELIRGELRKLINRAPAADELADNQANFIGRLPLQLESNEGVAGAIVNAERHGLGLDYYQRYPGLVAAVTRTDVLRAAKRFIDPDRLAIGTAGSETSEA